MRIGKLAKATNTKVETIRFYEREGILPPADRTDANYRDYSPSHLAKLTFIRRSRNLGFSMAQVRSLLKLSDNDNHPCAQVDAMARDHLEEIDRKIADLTALRAELAHLLGSCNSDRIGECRIVEALGSA
ncbi:helix-turn-helix domain-containing protein [Croceicoccus sp. F390]|uniref:Helix-turn-helix domain-containing protein n=1 Tax=Croceicoccus esteveae TaxID=3075597 RepID=A0ABU2ZDX6_9SPHN|nr:helix-turn-helix domain-containing protein [Croceicoccus sp. F390]MDT0574805.1 helix-turn-helix domain-containing protein [Croceicoccus sp. F390]